MGINCRLNYLSFLSIYIYIYDIDTHRDKYVYNTTRSTDKYKTHTRPYKRETTRERRFA